MASNLIIKSPRPGRNAAVIIIFMLVYLGSCYGAFYYGHERSGIDSHALQAAYDNIQQQFNESSQENAKLREDVAAMKQSAAIDKRAYNDVDGSLKSMQKEVLELKQQVAFYRGIVSPTQGAAGLNITSFKLNKLGEDAGYHFKLVLTQVKQNTRIIRGKASILIDGLDNGRPMQLDIASLTGKSKPDLELRFKYFQTIEGDMVLPNGFVPSSILVDLKASGGDQNTIKRTFNWLDVSS